MSELDRNAGLPSQQFATTTSRRAVLAAGAGLVSAAVLTKLAPPALAQKAAVSEVSVEELMKPGDLPDLVMGKADAKVTVVEYASMTCGHCATFHNTVLPEIKKKYVDSGQVRIIFREFPLDNLAAAGAMLARCAGGGDKTFDVIGTLFKQQDAWVVRGNPVPKLFETVKAAGFTQESFDKCLTDQKLLESITTVRARAAEKFGVNSTPTFFINGKRLAGAPTLAEFEKALEPLLKS